VADNDRQLQKERNMATMVYGASDDLIEIEGDVSGEVNYIPDGDDEKKDSGALLVFSDGTILAVKYGKAKGGIWAIETIKKGVLFDRIEECDDENADPYSDQSFFKDGLKWGYAATRWEKVN